MLPGAEIAALKCKSCLGTHWRSHVASLHRGCQRERERASESLCSFAASVSVWNAADRATTELGAAPAETLLLCPEQRRGGVSRKLLGTAGWEAGRLAQGCGRLLHVCAALSLG